jgi:hypothetical protein
MIWIFNLDRASAGVCDNYHDVFQYLSDIASSNTAPKHTSQSELFTLTDEDSLATKKNWCLNFCKVHNYTIIETPQIIDSNVPKWRHHHEISPIEELLERVS